MLNYFCKIIFVEFWEEMQEECFSKIYFVYWFIKICFGIFICFHPNKFHLNIQEFCFDNVFSILNASIFFIFLDNDHQKLIKIFCTCCVIKWSVSNLWIWYNTFNFKYARVIFLPSGMLKKFYPLLIKMHKIFSFVCSYFINFLSCNDLHLSCKLLGNWWFNFKNQI